MTGGSLLLVCTGCRAPRADPTAPRPGATLLQAVRAASPVETAPKVEGITCLSGCKRHCTAALTAPGRVTYLFGDLVPDAATALALLEASATHAAVPDGWLPRAGKPDLFADQHPGPHPTTALGARRRWRPDRLAYLRCGHPPAAPRLRCVSQPPGTPS